MDKLVGKKFSVSVTQDDIDKGVCSTKWDCAVAIAANRDLQERFQPDEPGVSVRFDNIKFIKMLSNINIHFDFDIGENLHSWLKSFDDKKNDIQPIDINFEIKSVKKETFFAIVLGEVEIVKS